MLFVSGQFKVMLLSKCTAGHASIQCNDTRYNDSHLRCVLYMCCTDPNNNTIPVFNMSNELGPTSTVIINDLASGANYSCVAVVANSTNVCSNALFVGHFRSQQFYVPELGTP